MLADLLGNKKSDDGDMNCVEYLVKQMTSFDDRRAKGWHPSSLFDMCPRAEIIMRLQDVVQESEPLHPKQRMMFDVGHAVHYWIQNHYLFWQLRGVWECHRCGARFFGMVRDHRHCPGCGVGQDYTFREVPVADDEYKIVGHSDGIFVSPVSAVETVIDIKTAGPRWWKSRSVSRKYNYQIQIYRELLDIDRAAFLFVDKASMESFPFHYEEVKNDGGRALRDAKEKIEVFNHANARKTFPMRLAECEKPGASRCKKCPVGHLCMTDQIAEPLEKRWQESGQDIEV